MNALAGPKSYKSFEQLFVAVMAGDTEQEDYTYHSVVGDIPELHEADLDAEGDVETYDDNPVGYGRVGNEYEVTLTDVHHKESGRPIEISALPGDIRDALEQKVLDEWLADRR